MDSLKKRRNTYEKLNYYDLITLCIKRKDKIDELKKENERLKDKIEKTHWWLEEMLKQAKSDETKAIINGTLELLLRGD